MFVIKKPIWIIIICTAMVIVIGMAVLLNQCDNKNILSEEQYSKTSVTDSSEQKDGTSSTENGESSDENSLCGEQNSNSGNINSSEFANSGSQNSGGQNESSDIIGSDKSESGESEWTELYPAIPVD